MNRVVSSIGRTLLFLVLEISSSGVFGLSAAEASAGVPADASITAEAHWLRGGEQSNSAWLDGWVCIGNKSELPTDSLRIVVKIVEGIKPSMHPYTATVHVDLGESPVLEGQATYCFPWMASVPSEAVKPGVPWKVLGFFSVKQGVTCPARCSLTVRTMTVFGYAPSESG